MRKNGRSNSFCETRRVNNVKLCSIQMGNEVVCEVTADYPLLFGIPPKLNKSWLREVLATALNGYFLRKRNTEKREVVRA